MFDLNGKRALVTGGTGGIGRACVETLIKLGASVVASGSNEAKLAGLHEALGVGVVRADLSNATAAKECVEGAAKLLNDEMDILILAAGITEDGLSMRMSIDSFRRVLEVNLTANFALAQAAVKYFRKRRSGRVVFISSVIPSVGNPGQANYAASKGGLEAMSRVLANEYATSGINFNCIAPGYIDTEMTRSLPDKAREAVLQRVPMGRMGVPSDVAGVAAFLCSDAAAYITGQVIHVNGGMYFA